MKPFISIVVIGYNIEDYILNCIQSILKSTYTNYEVIFVDDGSTDKTLNIVKGVRDSHLRVFSKINGGCVSARKFGLQYASGEYVCFVDGDDWVGEDYLNNFVDAVQSDTDVVCAPFFQQTKDMHFVVINNMGISYCQGYDYLKNIVSERLPHYMFNKMFRKQFLIDAGYLNFLEISMAEDLMTNILIGIKAPKVTFSIKPSYFYRYNINSLTKAGNKKLLEQIRTIDYIGNCLKNAECPTKDQIMDALWMEYFCSYCSFVLKSKIVYKIAIESKKRICNPNNEYISDYMSVYSGLRRKYIKMIYKFPYIVFFVFPLLRLIRNSRKGLYDLLNKTHKSFMKRKFHKLTCKYIAQKAGKSIFLIGTSDRSNLGDQAIADSEVKFLTNYFEGYEFFEITGDHYRLDKETIKRLIKKDDIIFITGGGFLGDLWMDEEQMVRDVIQIYKDNKIIVLPQTICFIDRYSINSEFEKSIEIYRTHDSLFFMCRDRKSYEFISKLIPNNRTGLFPDMALYGNVDFTSQAIDNHLIYFCFRTDQEAVISKQEKNKLKEILENKGYKVEYISTLNSGSHNGDITVGERSDKLKKYLAFLSRGYFIFTDRLHGMILSTLAGVPCIAFDNSSNKVSGVYTEWMDSLETVLVCGNIDEALRKFEILAGVRRDYSDAYLQNVKQQFVCRLKEIVV